MEILSIENDINDIFLKKYVFFQDESYANLKIIDYLEKSSRHLFIINTFGYRIHNIILLLINLPEISGLKIPLNKKKNIKLKKILFDLLTVSYETLALRNTNNPGDKCYIKNLISFNELKKDI